eukprot:1861229-Karenia_brevis.AAC.1
MPRHIISQNDKWRPIDDGKHSEHNNNQTAEETIVCNSPTFLALAGKRLVRSISSKSEQAMPEWLTLRAGIEDMWKGYRQFFARAEDLPFLITCFVHPTTLQLQFHRLWGLPFGLAA